MVTVLRPVGCRQGNKFGVKSDCRVLQRSWVLWSEPDDDTAGAHRFSNLRNVLGFDRLEPVSPFVSTQGFPGFAS